MIKSTAISILDKLDNESIAQAILTAKRGDGTDNQISSVAKELALHLVQGWIEKYADQDFNGPGILGVELPFYIWIDPLTLAVGVQDRIVAEGLNAPFPAMGNEWKTRTPPKQKRYGEESWLADMMNGVQLGTYALALRRGSFIQPDGSELYANPNGGSPNDAPIRFSVRAALKEIPPRFWPTDPTAAVFTFTKQHTDYIKAALSNRAASIRAMRSNQALIPWQTTGRHCFNQFGRTCEFLEKYCGKHEPPARKGVPGWYLTPGDPGAAAAKVALGDKEPDPQLVILSASAYELGSLCMEKYAIESSGTDRNGGDEALDVGTGFHSGVAEVNRQIMRLQRESE